MIMFRCEHHDRIDSTSAQALRVWRDPGEQATQPLLITADEQTAGVGRNRRTWHSPRGGLWLTAVWPVSRRADHYQALPLAVGLAVAQSVESVTGLAVAIKWPNDLLIRDRKVCGVLCQYEAADPPVVLAGIGLNANLPAASLGPDLRQPATSLADELGYAVDLPRLRGELHERLGATLGRYDAAGLTPLGAAIRERLAWVGRTVRCELPGSQVRSGTLRDIDEQGRLVLDTPRGPTEIAAGELVHLCADRPDHPHFSITASTECVR